jgi:hypothetical protein
LEGPDVRLKACRAVKGERRAGTDRGRRKQIGCGKGPKTSKGVYGEGEEGNAGLCEFIDKNGTRSMIGILSGELGTFASAAK